MIRSRLTTVAGLVLALGVPVVLTPASTSASTSPGGGASLVAAQEGGFDPGAPPPGVGDDTSPSTSGARRAGAVAVALSMAVLLVWVNRGSLLRRAGLVPGPGVQRLRTSPAPRPVGVGRFARARDGRPPPL